jgi:hypothetical protein
MDENSATENPQETSAADTPLKGAGIAAYLKTLPTARSITAERKAEVLYVGKAASGRAPLPPCKDGQPLNRIADDLETAEMIFSHRVRNRSLAAGIQPDQWL